MLTGKQRSKDVGKTVLELSVILNEQPIEVGCRQPERCLHLMSSTECISNLL